MVYYILGMVICSGLCSGAPSCLWRLTGICLGDLSWASSFWASHSSLRTSRLVSACYSHCSSGSDMSVHGSMEAMELASCHSYHQIATKTIHMAEPRFWGWGIGSASLEELQLDGER